MEALILPTPSSTATYESYEKLTSNDRTGDEKHVNPIETASILKASECEASILTPTTPVSHVTPGQEIEIDFNIKSALPDGCKFAGATAYGSSAWTQTAKITALDEANDEVFFFLKTAGGKLGETMFQGEFASMTAINTAVPDFSPKPIAWGRCRDDPELFFYLSTFVEMIEGELPVPKEFCENLVKMHCQSTSPTGKFGFHVTTCNGNVPQNNSWDESWESFYAAGLRHMLVLDRNVNGEQPELMDAIQPIFDHVIPRLLRPLQEGPASIRPALVHGDLWYGNCSMDMDTDKPVIFDAAAFYAHNEYELGNWRPSRNRLRDVYMDIYKTLNPPAHPVEEFDDRIMLYELRFNFHFCIMVSGLKNIKREMISNMRYLANKYGSVDLGENAEMQE